MKSLQISCWIVVFVAYGISYVESQSCTLQKVGIICDKVDSIEWSLLGKLRTCIGNHLFNSTVPESSISSVVYSNGSDVFHYANIEALQVESATVKFIPTGIMNKFRYIKALKIVHSGLLSVNKGNLKEFGDSLEFLNLNDNKLTILDGDLFEYNKNLKTANFIGNPIRHIDHAFFSNLNNLKNLHSIGLYEVLCMDQEFIASGGKNIATFKWKNEKCTDESARIETQNLIKRLSCDEDNNKILKSVDDLRNDLHQQIDELRKKSESMDKKLDTLLSIVTRLDGRLVGK